MFEKLAVGSTYTSLFKLLLFDLTDKTLPIWTFAGVAPAKSLVTTLRPLQFHQLSSTD